MNTKPAHAWSAISQEAIRHAVETAVWAPSVHNTQPWWFGTRDRGAGPVISLHADVERRMDVADPDGREMLISCGAALLTMRTAIMHLGRVPEVTLLPDPDRPALIADVGFGPVIPVTEEVRRLYGEVRRRRSHRGAFRDEAVGAPVLATLTEETRREGAHLHVAIGRDRIALGALTEAAEQVQRMNPAYVSEAARWSPPPGSTRQDGVHERAYPRTVQRTEPHFPMRDYARGQGWGTVAIDADTAVPAATGVVVIVTTDRDGRPDWVTAGQALQRMLLRASAAGVSASFHTQALEIPELREFIRTRFCGGAHPQVLMRLGLAEGELETVRRPADHVITEELL